ncbi:hypothetical protein [Curtobacterium sp. MCBD17_040]|uniref:hypothetical protein n=1 Tax=Curtobacterium sp. MCBD17_040 TaxID=2175674 RepID=UPI000DA84A02|nr:hypothetical protein [Curtobacterium sp. MCBD17_040]WIB65700.1 hypothetical protein DEI94_16395 [Curtobacterium sp. MCBD17_040]
MATSTQLRRGNTGKGGNKGLFDGHLRTGDEVTLDGLTTKAFNKRFDTTYRVTDPTYVPDRIVVDGVDVNIVADGRNVWGDGVSVTYVASTADFDIEVDVYENSRAFVEDAVAAGILDKRIDMLRAAKRVVPAEQHGDLHAEIARLTQQLPMVEDGWGHGEALTLAHRVTNASLEETEITTFPEGAGSAYVDEDAITYERTLPPAFLAEIFTGEAEPDLEGEAATERYWGLYENRVTNEDLNTAERFIRERYGLDFEDSFEYGDELTLRTRIPTVVNGRPVSLEWAKQQVADGFARLRDDLDSDTLQIDLATALGFICDDESGRFYRP